ncbi:hypothetical protein AAGG49_23120, partial [Stenotrophomonas maltophilia]|uniref:hypothetical protein n=1 Tax=Stenotrophomonas maltophilia TaxID=40324 RepID=UPI00313EAF46
VRFCCFIVVRAVFCVGGGVVVVVLGGCVAYSFGFVGLIGVFLIFAIVWGYAFTLGGVVLGFFLCAVGCP